MSVQFRLNDGQKRFLRDLLEVKIESIHRLHEFAVNFFEDEERKNVTVDLVDVAKQFVPDFKAPTVVEFFRQSIGLSNFCREKNISKIELPNLISLSMAAEKFTDEVSVDKSEHILAFADIVFSDLVYYMSRYIDVYYSNEKNLKDVKFFIDFRPIFDEARESVKFMFPVGRLSIRYIDESGNPAFVNVYMDSEEVTKLKDECVLAEKKIKSSINSLDAGLGFKFFVPGGK